MKNSLFFIIISFLTIGIISYLILKCLSPSTFSPLWLSSFLELLLILGMKLHCLLCRLCSSNILTPDLEVVRGISLLVALKVGSVYLDEGIVCGCETGDESYRCLDGDLFRSDYRFSIDSAYLFSFTALSRCLCKSIMCLYSSLSLSFIF
jgi:hypothetical protein